LAGFGSLNRTNINQPNNHKEGTFMTSSFWIKGSRTIAIAVIASGFIWSGSTAFAAGHAKFAAQDADQEEAAAEINSTAQATANATPRPQIDGLGTLNVPNSTRRKPVQFIMFGVANDQAPGSQFLFGEFFYCDKNAHISFTTGKIETVTINGDQGAFTGTARIGGPRNKQTVQFTVMVTANQNFPSGHFFSIALSNGYTASGNLKSGEIVIHDVDPD
jgi:hypothetical protein